MTKCTVAQDTDRQKCRKHTVTDLQTSRYIWRPNAKTSHVSLTVSSVEILFQKQPSLQSYDEQLAVRSDFCQIYVSGST